MTTEHTVVSFRQIKKKAVQFSGGLLANYRDLCSPVRKLPTLGVAAEDHPWIKNRELADGPVKLSTLDR